MKNHTKYTAIVSTILLTSALAGPANAETPTTASLEKVPTTTSQLETVKADNTSKITFERTSVTTTPAPKVVAAVAAPVPVQALKVEEKPAVLAKTAPVAAQAAPVASPKPAAPVPAAAFGNGAAIAAAAYAQLGVAQDCTALATKAIAAVGINFHGWPAGYLSLGRTVSSAEAQPGDLAYYQNGGSGLAHIAVYVGGGKAIHGGWNGGTTSLQSVNVGSGPVFIRVA
jgi:cell wall-associated NlpC family hydrolase